MDDQRPEAPGEEQPGGPDSPVLEAEQEISQAEIEAAKERERQAQTVELGATFAERFAAALTGTTILVTVLAIVSALVIGAFIIALSHDATREALTYFFARPTDALASGWEVVSAAYFAMFRGALGGSRQLSETLVAATPLILTGLAVAVPLRTGLFNIGGEGQVIAGGVVGGFVGFAFVGLPLVIHLPLAVLAGLVAGGLYGWLPGILKARTGAHEVISTIMLNNIGILVSTWLLTTTLFRQPDRTDPISRPVADSAMLPRLLPNVPGLRVNAGLIVALLLAAAVFWMMERSTVGFELNAVGLNANAAATAGMNPGRSIVTAMSTGGALAGAAGAAMILGISHRITPGFSAGIGFEGITVALLGRGGIGGTVAAGLLFGALRAGGRSMQAETGTALDLVLVIQALIIVFIAAPGLVRALFRIKAADLTTGQVSKGWGT